MGFGDNTINDVIIDGDRGPTLCNGMRIFNRGNTNINIRASNNTVFVTNVSAVARPPCGSL